MRFRERQNIMELGIYSFGDTQHDKNGELRATSEAITNLLEAIKLADTTGLDYFGVGEHHTNEMPASSPGTVIAAAAATTSRIKLSSAVSVLSTDDPVRVFQQFAIADAISGGRVEITAGRGSSTESFPLFGYSLDDYNELYAEKLDLLLKLNASERITWRGKYRPALDDVLIVPRPVNGTLPIWLATGGTPTSSVRAGIMGLPIAYAIIGGYPKQFAPLADLYRKTAKNAGHPDAQIKVSVASIGLIKNNSQDTKDLFWEHWSVAMAIIGEQRGWSPPTRDSFERQAGPEGALFVGNPEEIANRIVALHRHLGHMRQFFQMDLGGLPQSEFLQSIELLATEVMPRVRKMLAE